MSEHNADVPLRVMFEGYNNINRANAPSMPIKWVAL